MRAPAEAIAAVTRLAPCPDDVGREVWQERIRQLVDAIYRQAFLAGADLTEKDLTDLDALELGRINYRTYRTWVGGRSVHGEALPDFDATPEPVRGAWCAAAVVTGGHWEALRMQAAARDAERTRRRAGGRSRAAATKGAA